MRVCEKLYEKGLTLTSQIQGWNGFLLPRSGTVLECKWPQGYVAQVRAEFSPIQAQCLSSALECHVHYPAEVARPAINSILNTTVQSGGGWIIVLFGTAPLSCMNSQQYFKPASFVSLGALYWVLDSWGTSSKQSEGPAPRGMAERWMGLERISPGPKCLSCESTLPKLLLRS